MATEGVGVGSPQDGGTMGDRISGLSDELLHKILRCLDSTPEAARTSVLARRWRRVWVAVPDLSFRYDHESLTLPVCRRIGEALAACSSPTVDRLQIAMPRTPCRFRLYHADRWLRFASQRLSGELCLSMAGNWDESGKAIVLPPCARATAIRFDLYGNTLRFEQTAGAGTFTALSTLRIQHGYMDSRELEDVLSSRCPGLKELVLGDVYFLHGASSGLCIRTDSLEHLEIFGFTEFHGRLEVEAPKLRFFSPRCRLSNDARIVAPMLSEVRWYGYPYNPMRHHLVGVGRHLRRLDVQTNSPSAALMKLFDTIDDLNLTINIKKCAKHYHKFLKNIDNIPKCENLLVRFIWKEHAFMSTMLYLLKKCTWIRKLEVFMGSSAEPSCLSHCPCRLQTSWITDSITLDSLKEVEIYFSRGSTELLQLITLLSNIAAILEKIIISYESSSASLLSKEVCKEVHSVCQPKIKVEFCVLSCRERLSYYTNKI